MATQCKDHATFNHLLRLIIKWKHITFYYQMHPEHRKPKQLQSAFNKPNRGFEKMKGELCPSFVSLIAMILSTFHLQRFLRPLVLSIFDTCWWSKYIFGYRTDKYLCLFQKSAQQCLLSTYLSQGFGTLVRLQFSKVLLTLGHFGLPSLQEKSSLMFPY